LLGGDVALVSPGAYVVLDGGSDVGLSFGQGLFYGDIRHLWRCVIGVRGERICSGSVSLAALGCG